MGPINSFFINNALVLSEALLVACLLLWLFILVCFYFAIRETKRKPNKIVKSDTELKASLAAIHYNATRLHRLLGNEFVERRHVSRSIVIGDQFQEQRYIAQSIIKECEDRIPELKGN
jgi:hypothetical protein